MTALALSLGLPFRSHFGGLGGGASTYNPEARVTVVTKVADTGASASPSSVIWDTEVVDELSAWEVGSPTRLTVPAGVSWVKLAASVNLSLVDSNSATTLSIRLNGTTTVIDQGVGTASTTPTRYCATGPIAVIPGDYFEVRTTSASDPTYTVVGAQSTVFSMEEVLA